MKIISVVGARPNFMKIAPFIRAIESYNKQYGIKEQAIDHVLVHTGQHYDDRMSRMFFDELGIPQANINLGIGSGSHAFQIGNTMIEFEKVLQNEKPDWVVVVGDVNATLACTVTAKKEHIKVCHIEAGLRSKDMTMPEEINRLVTDRLSDLLLTPDTIANENLIQEGVSEKNIGFVGNIMIDTLEANRSNAYALDLNEIIKTNLFKTDTAPEKINNNYAIITLHRPSNVDQKSILGPIVDLVLNELPFELPVIWPIHPRTKNKLIEFGLWERLNDCKNIILLHPIGYVEMLRLNRDAKLMITDSGGIQEECTVLGTPCLTLRWNTERPVTLKENGGVNILVGNDIEKIRKGLQEIKNLKAIPYKPKFWDGNTAERCLQAILNYQT